MNMMPNPRSTGRAQKRRAPVSAYVDMAFVVNEGEFALPTIFGG